MTMSGPTCGTLIDTNMIGLGAIGVNRTNMSDSVGIGVIAHIQAAAVWAATITGTTGGTGTVGGTPGIFETTPGSPFIPTVLGAEILAEWLSLSKAPGGINGLPTATAIASAVSAHITLADYFGTPPTIPVCVGTGIIAPGSFSGMSGTVMGGLIKTELIVRGADPETAINLDHFCNGIGNAVVNAIQTRGTGSVNATHLSGSCSGSLSHPTTGGVV